MRTLVAPQPLAEGAAVPQVPDEAGALDPFLPAPARATPLPLPSFADKLRRVLWGVGRLLFYRPVPTPLHGVRRAVLRLFGARVGPGAHPYPRARIWAPWNLVIEADSCLADEVDCYNVAPVVLGRGAIVSQKAYLCTAGHDIRDPRFALTVAQITLGPGAWVATDAFVGPGVTVGEGAVLGARAVLMRTLPAWTVATGNPARAVRRRAPVRSTG